MYVKQRAGHLSYQEDPKGYHSVLSQSLTKDQSIGKLLQSADIKSLSSDPLILAFAEYLCYSHHPQVRFYFVTFSWFYLSPETCLRQFIPLLSRVGLVLQYFREGPTPFRES